MHQAQILYRQQDCYALAMYAAGLAVECLLRAFKGQKEFDERHDLRKLFQASGLLRLSDRAPVGISAERLREYEKELKTAVSTIFLLWSNDYRFASEDRLRSHLKKEEMFRQGIRGDILKALAVKLLNACQIVIARGSQLWSHWSRK